MMNDKPLNPYRVVGASVASARESLGLSQSQLGEICHVSRSTIHRWENGRGAPDIVQARAIEREAGKALDEF